MKQLLAKDNTVVAAVRRPDRATALQELQQQHHPQGQGSRNQLHITRLDVSDPQSIGAWAGTLRDVCPGLRHLDVVINNAGVCAGCFCSVLNCENDLK